MRKAIIYMEVACGHCGGIINRNYKNSTSVKWLKNATSDWRYTKEYGNICPNCLRGKRPIRGCIEISGCCM